MSFFFPILQSQLIKIATCQQRKKQYNCDNVLLDWLVTRWLENVINPNW